jgi:hypothetical protein
MGQRVYVVLPALEYEGTVRGIHMLWSPEAKARLLRQDITDSDALKVRTEELAWLAASRLGDVKTKVLYAQLETS